MRRPVWRLAVHRVFGRGYVLGDGRSTRPVPGMCRLHAPAAADHYSVQRRGERRLAPYLAELLYDTALHAQVAAPDRYGGVLSGADAVVFVPATAAAFRRRGFDHMEAIARPFCELSGVPLLDALVKYGHGDQRELGREERRERARGMYETVEDVRGRRLLLIDDVITTGATMAAASAELKRAGAAAVDGLAIARVW